MIHFLCELGVFAVIYFHGRGAKERKDLWPLFKHTQTTNNQ